MSSFLRFYHESLFMRLSLILCRCDAEWWCRWLYNTIWMQYHDNVLFHTIMVNIDIIVKYSRVLFIAQMVDKGLFTFHKDISTKLTVIARRDFELVSLDVIIAHVSHYLTKTHPSVSKSSTWKSTASGLSKLAWVKFLVQFCCSSVPNFLLSVANLDNISQLLCIFTKLISHMEMKKASYNKFEEHIYLNWFWNVLKR